jgi:hypothetical protein
MKNLSLVVCLLLASRLIGQQANSSLDFVSGFDYTYRTWSKRNPGTYELILKDQNERPRVNARFGFNYGRNISERFSFKTGLRYAQVGYHLNERKVLFWPDNRTAFVDSGIEGDQTLTHIFQYRFIEVPIALRYSFKSESGSKFTPFLEAGVSPNVYINTRYMDKHVTRLQTNRYVSSTRETHVEKIHWVAQIAYGFNYNLNQ